MKNDKRLTAYYLEHEHMRIMKVLKAFNALQNDYKNNIRFWKIIGFLHGKLQMLEEMKGLTDL